MYIMLVFLKRPNLFLKLRKLVSTDDLTFQGNIRRVKTAGTKHRNAYIDQPNLKAKLNHFSSAERQRYFLNCDYLETINLELTKVLIKATV